MYNHQNTDIEPPWMQGAKDISGQEMIVVHMSDGELEGLDNLQHGPSVDPDTGIREYSALAEIIEIPEIREVFRHVTDELIEHGKLSPELHNIYKSAHEHSLPYQPSPEERDNSLLKKAEHTGRDGDTKLALIPLNLALFLIELKHEPTINPKTGLLEFGFFKSIGKFFKNVVSNPIRAAGTIAGFMLGGPLGAGIGNAAGSMASGQSFGKSLRTGAMVGGGLYGLQGLGQAAGLLGGTNLISQGLGSMGVGAVPGFSSAAGAAGAAGTPGMTAATSAGHLAKASAAAPASTSGGWMDTIGNFMSKAAPFAPIAVGGLAYMGNKQHHKKKSAQDMEERNFLAQERERMGFNRPLSPITPSTRRPNPRFSQRTDLERKYGIFSEPAFIDNGYAKGGLVKSYNKGNLVTGKGKGQDDKIKTSVPDGSYIIDASSTSMFGDGSTKAGSDMLKQFENHIKSKFPNKVLKKVEKEISRKSSQVPVWLSDGEHKIDPVTVTLLGHGSNVNGADILKNMVIKLRKHKISKGSGLPPKAKNPMQYI